MSCLPIKRTHVNKTLMLAVLAGSLLFPGCGKPGEGTVQIPRGPGGASAPTPDQTTSRCCEVQEGRTRTGGTRQAPPGRGRMSG